MAASIRIRTSLLKNLYLPRTTCILCRQCQSTTASSTTVESQGKPPSQVNGTDIPRGQINIPKKKKRDSLSILKALASTVGKDPTGPSYQFMDDPKLIPDDRNQKKLCLLSKASGKRAARFMVNEYRNTFDHDAAKPHVKAFQPDITDYQHTDASPEALEERISRREVNDAIEVYNRMSEEGIEVSPQLQLSFLELLCVFSCKDQAPALMLEERVIDDIEFQEDVHQNKIGMDLADDIFQTLPDKTADAYNWIVRGLLKVGNSKGLLYYKEMKDSNLPVYLGTYNELIRNIAVQKDKKWKNIENFLHEMKKEKVTPTLETFHSVLMAMESTEGQSLAIHVPAVLAEMKVLNIEPTLQTWSLVLSALVSKEDGNGRWSSMEGYGIMSDIIDIIQHIWKDIDKLHIDHSTENFLVKAMVECRKYRDTEVAMMLYKLKEEMGHRYIITSLRDEDIFYNTLLTLLSHTETPDDMMNVYRKVCPSLHTANLNCLKSMLDNLEMYRAYPHILQLWQDTDFHLKRLGRRALLLWKFLGVFTSDHVPQEFGQQFLPEAKRLYDERVQNPDVQIEDAKLFGNLIRIFLRNQELDYAWEATMYFYTKDLQGDISYEDLTRVLEMCIKEQDVQKIMSFCNLPELVRIPMVQAASKVFSENESILQECLDTSQLEKLEEAFAEE